MKKAMFFLIPLLLLIGCGGGNSDRGEEALARKICEALHAQRVETIGTCIISEADLEYLMTYFSLNTREYQAMTLEEKRQFEALFQKRLDEMKIAYNDQYERMVDQIDQLLQYSGFDWDKLRFEEYLVAFPDREIEYMPRYGEFVVRFSIGKQNYSLHTDGIVKVKGEWKLQMGEFILEEVDDDA